MKIVDILKHAKEVGDAVDPIMDLLLLTGFLRESKRRKEKVLNEKFVPKFAVADWHKQRNALILTQLNQNEQYVLAVWRNGLAEEQQAHWIVSLANFSWAEDSAQEKVHFGAAVDLCKNMVSLPNDDERTAYADSLDFIKDPATEYFQVRIQQAAGRQFTDPASMLNWMKANLAVAAASVAQSAGDINRQLDAYGTTLRAKAVGNRRTRWEKLIDKLIK